MGKNIKSYATIPSPFPREREGSLTAKVLKFFVLNMVRLNRTPYSHLKIYGLTVHIIQNFSIFSKTSHKVIIPANYADSTQFAHTVRELRETRTFLLNLFYIMFQAPAPAENPGKFQRITQIPRSSPTQSANYTKFAPFINIMHYVSDA